jgi:hypothetical protein
VVSSASVYSGYVEGYADVGQVGDGTYDVYGLGASGVLAYQLDANWQIEGELAITNFGLSDADWNYAETSGYGVGHVNYYVDNFSVGVFGGAASIGSSYGGVTAGVGGVEGQVWLASGLALGGRIGYVGSFDGYYADSSPVKVWVAEASEQYFITDNFKLEAKLGLAKGDSWNTDSVDLVEGNVEAAYQFDNSPVSVFAEYSYIDDQYYDTNYLTLKVGARFAIGDESLKSQAAKTHELFDLSGIEANRWW